MLRKLTYISFLLFSLCLAETVDAQNDTGGRSKPTDTISSSGNRPLTLDDAIFLAFENNLTIEIARSGLKIAEFERALAKGERGRAIAKLGISEAGISFRKSTLDTIRDVQIAYWSLVNALRELQIKQDNLRITTVLLEKNRILIGEGRLSPLELRMPEVQISNLESAFYDTREKVIEAENTLKTLITGNRADPLWSFSIVPVEAVNLEVPKIHLEDALKAAMLKRPELDVNEGLTNINEIDQKYYRERGKESALGKSLVEADILKARRKMIEMQIEVEIRDAFLKLQNAEARLDAAIIARQNLEMLYEDDRKKLATGESNTRQVLESQNNLLEARLRELSAQTELNKAIARMQWAAGNSLSSQ